MRHALGLAVTLAGCNQIFGLANTTLLDAPSSIDAKFFDAPADAPFVCPPLGGTPVFSSELHQFAVGCSNYTASEDGQIQIASCGRVAAQWDPIQGFVAIPTLASLMVDDPRVTPEGDELYVVLHPSQTTSTIEAYRRDVTGQWQHDRTIDAGITLGVSVYLGAPTRGPTRRMVVSDYNNFSAFDEYEIEFDTSSAHVFHQYTTTELGGAPVYYAPYLSPDGSRMYYSPVQQPMFLWDRADRSTVFTSPRMVPTAPQISESFMTNDCARLYVYSNDLHALFWVQQQ